MTSWIRHIGRHNEKAFNSWHTPVYRRVWEWLYSTTERNQSDKLFYKMHVITTRISHFLSGTISRCSWSLWQVIPFGIRHKLFHINSLILLCFTLLRGGGIKGRTMPHFTSSGFYSSVLCSTDLSSCYSINSWSFLCYLVEPALAVSITLQAICSLLERFSTSFLRKQFNEWKRACLTKQLMPSPRVWAVLPAIKPPVLGRNLLHSAFLQ